MRNTVLSFVALGLLSVVVACGSSGGTNDGGAGGGGSGGGSGSGSGGAASSGSGGGSGGGSSSGSSGGASTVTSVAFPQAIDDGMFANPVAYPSVPVHVAIGGMASAVSVAIDGAAAIDATDAHDGTWLATVPIASLSAGPHTIVASATGRGGAGAPTTKQATLAIGSAGMQMTNVAQYGNAGTPRLLAIGGKTYVTFTDRTAAHADAYIDEIGGAGSWVGTKTSLVGSANDVLNARTAVSDDAKIAVLYQEGTPSNPYVNFLEVVDLAGNKLVPPIALEPQGMYGSYGGDVAWDGAAFVATWRSNDGAGKSQLMWLRVTPDGQKTGPVIVTPLAEDAGQAEGGFDAITPIHIAAHGGQSVISFVSYHQDAIAASLVPKARVSVIGSDGTIAKTSYCAGSDDAQWYTEARSFVNGASFVPLWGAKSLMDSDPNPAVKFFATTLDASGEPGAAATVVNQVDDRAEPFALAHPSMNAVAAWLDLRSEHANPQAGHIQLFAASIDASMKEGTEVIFDHARFVEGTSDLNALGAGTNVMLVWLDERHGGNIMNPKPEVYLETVWY